MIQLSGYGFGDYCALVDVYRGGSTAVATAARCLAVSLVLMVLGSALYLDGMREFQGVSRGAAFSQVGLEVEACLLISPRVWGVRGLVLRDRVR